MLGNVGACLCVCNSYWKNNETWESGENNRGPKSSDESLIEDFYTEVWITTFPGSKVHGPHVGHANLFIWVMLETVNTVT